MLYIFVSFVTQAYRAKFTRLRFCLAQKRKQGTYLIVGCTRNLKFGRKVVDNASYGRINKESLKIFIYLCLYIYDNNFANTFF